MADHMPDEVKQVKEAIEANAAKANLELPNPVYAYQDEDGSWIVCDNYERFFDLIYVCREGKWFIRHMYSDIPEEEYSFELAMADASIMYTG